MEEAKIIIDEGYNENWDTYQPDVTLKKLSDSIQIGFTRKAADAVNIYRRQHAHEPWEFIATTVNSPFDDHEAEVNWEYCIRGVKENAEVGIPVVLSVSDSNNNPK